MVYTTSYESLVGELTLASDGEAVCGLWIAGQKYHGASLPEAPVRNDNEPVLRELRLWLDAYFAGKRPSTEGLPLVPRGSAFRQAVWRLLLDIPYGQTVSYGELAAQLAVERGRSSARSVGGAVGHNPISIVIPCHRVVGASGSLTGYAGGLSAKVKLLELEGVDMSRLTVPKKGTAL